MVDLSTSGRATAFRQLADNSAEGQVQAVLLVLADLWDNMDVPDVLSGVSTKSQVAHLLTYDGFPANNAPVVQRLGKARITRETWNGAKHAMNQLVAQLEAEKPDENEDFLAGVEDEDPSQEDVDALINFVSGGGVAVTETSEDQSSPEPPGEGDEEPAKDSDDTPSVSQRTDEEDIQFVLSYPTSLLKAFIDDWSVGKLRMAIEIERANKNRKTAFRVLERAIRKRIKEIEPENPEDESGAEKDPQVTAPPPELSEVEQARHTIQDAIDSEGPYSHNIIGLTLSRIAAEQGYAVANRLVEEYDLEARYGIRTVQADDPEGSSVPKPAAEDIDIDEADQLPLLPEKTPPTPDAMILSLSRLVRQVAHVPTPPQPFIDSVALVQLQPVLVRKKGDLYLLVDGRRRVKALQAWADREDREYHKITIRAEVFDADSWTHDGVMALKSNAERSPNVINELQHIEALIAQGYTEKQIAEATGMRVQTIRKRLKLATLEPTLREALDEGRIAPGVAEKAANLSADQQREIAAQDGRITGNDVREQREVQVAEIVELFEGVDTPPRESVESRLSDIELMALIETTQGAVRDALLELKTFRARYGTQEAKDGTDQ